MDLVPHFLTSIVAVIPYPRIDPIIFRIGPFAIHWYAIAYIVGLLLGWRYVVHLNERPPRVMTRDEIYDLLIYMMLGVVLGGRIGYIVFYQPGYYLAHPLQVIYLWRGGMSFHGGLAGTIVVMLWFARRRDIRFFAVADLSAAAAPIGLFLGRIANFVNGELYGRPTDLPWAMVFPKGGPIPRHPSQLYEATLEGIVLFSLLAWLAWFTRSRRHPGVISGAFLVGYAVARILVEFVREPDPQLGLILGPFTMGQILSLPVLIFGLWLIRYAWRSKPYEDRVSAPIAAGKGEPDPTGDGRGKTGKRDGTGRDRAR